jgi:hypothetical protein
VVTLGAEELKAVRGVGHKQITMHRTKFVSVFKLPIFFPLAAK